MALTSSSPLNTPGRLDPHATPTCHMLAALSECVRRPRVLIPRTGGEGTREASDPRATRQAADSPRTSCAEHPEQRAAACERMRPRKAQLELKAADGPIPAWAGARRT